MFEIVMLSVLGLSFLLDVLLLFTLTSKVPRKIIAGLSLLCTFFVIGVLVSSSVSLAEVMLLLLLAFRIVIPLRYIEARLPLQELTARNARSLIFFFVPTLALIIYIHYLDATFAFPITLLALVQFAATLVVVLSLAISAKLYRVRKDRAIESDKLPTVSVCIPARNETQNLSACVEAVLASTYPKLEIIVLDDCSHDKTPELIKKYAHAGVRFINGNEPDQNWVAKNSAYLRLQEESRGEILVFIGVDIVLKPESITELVAQLGTDDMLSVLPIRARGSEQSFIFQPIRYWWELGVWRFSIKRPPVLSSCWAIRREVLASLGGFSSVKKSIDPEAVFAARVHSSAKYGFIVANSALGVSSTKSADEQLQTALRKRYPQMRRRPESVAALIFFELFVFVAPLVVAAFTFSDKTLVFWVSCSSLLLAACANAFLYRLTLSTAWLVGVFTMPLLALADCYLLLRSMYAYEFGEVIWKERNVCLPLLTVEKSLPKID